VAIGNAPRLRRGGRFRFDRLVGNRSVGHWRLPGRGT
jgi:hypothetical protein